MATIDLLNRFNGRISNARKDGVVKARELRDSAKISVGIRERQNSIRKMYRELGKAYYQRHKNDVSCEYKDKIAAIRCSFEEMNELKAQMDSVRGIRRCSNCGQVLSAETRFCPNCGKRWGSEAAEGGVSTGEEDAVTKSGEEEPDSPTVEGTGSKE